MGFRGNNSKNSFKARIKAPVRLTFGLVEEKNQQLATDSAIVTKPLYEQQEITGTLNLKKIRLDDVKPLTDKQIKRILKNLEQIYEEGRYSSVNTLIDAEGKILKVSFNYNQNVIDRLRGLDRNERQWDPDNRLWKVFIGCFDDLFDILGRGFKLTENAYANIRKFVRTKYYAYLAQGKFGKLLVRESWYEEFDLNSNIPDRTAVALAVSDTDKDESKLTTEQWRELELIEEQIEHFQFKRKPYSHQLTGIKFLLQNNTCALLDEMGCGKSFQIATSIAILLNNKSIDRCLIVAPKSLIHTWKEELKLATPLPYTVIEGSPAQREKLLKSSTSIFIIHYEGVRLEKEALTHWMQNGTGMIIFDESQRIKNPNAQTTISSKYVRNQAKRCVIATGTPIANRPIDLFAQYFVMDNGATFGTNFAAFKNTFCYIEQLEITQGRRKIKIEKFLGVRNGEELRKRIQATSLRRLKKDVLDLPPIIFKNYDIELKTEQKSLYAKMRDHVRNEIETMSEEEYRQQANNIVVRLLRLSQLTSNPNLINKNYTGSNAKFEELDDILNDIFDDETKKIILWSHFVENVNILKESYIKKYGAVAHTGEMSTNERNTSVDEFQNNPSCRLFIATPQSAKEGLTLLAKDGKMQTDTMIYLDLNFDAGGYIQSQARFHRIGQGADKCLVIHLIAKDTVDEYIKKSIINKIKTAVQLLDNASSDELEKLKGEKVQALNKNDLLSLLT